MKNNSFKKMSLEKYLYNYKLSYDNRKSNY